MKRLTCEMCGSTDLIKENGVFVCQSCGCKYSVEEAKKMMVEGTVEVTGTVSVDNQKKIANLQELAQRAREAGDSKTAARYYSQLLLEDPSDWAANFYSVYYDAHNIRLNEIAYAANRVGGILDTVFRLIREEQDKKIAAIMEEKKDADPITRQILEETCKVETRTTYINICADVKKFCYLLIDNALNLGNAGAALNAMIPAYHMLIQSGDVVIKYFGNYEIALKVYSSVGWNLLDDLAKTCRSSLAYELRNLVDSRIAQAQRLAQEEATRKEQQRLEEERKKQQERNDKYWSEHTEEKQALEQAGAVLTAKIETLTTECNQKVAELKNEKEKVPGADEISHLAAQIIQLRQEHKSLGFFKMKEKKMLTERMEELEKLSNQKKEIRMARQNEIQSKITDVSNAYLSQIRPFQDELDSIHAELTKNR